MGKFIRWMGRTLMPNRRCPDEEKFIKLIQLMLDDESTPEENQYILSHIDGCYRCFDNYDLEKAIKEALKSNGNKLEVTNELIDKIKSKIETE